MDQFFIKFGIRVFSQDVSSMKGNRDNCSWQNLFVDFLSDPFSIDSTSFVVKQVGNHKFVKRFFIISNPYLIEKDQSDNPQIKSKKNSPALNQATGLSNLISIKEGWSLLPSPFLTTLFILFACIFRIWIKLNQITHKELIDHSKNTIKQEQEYCQQFFYYLPDIPEGRLCLHIHILWGSLAWRWRTHIFDKSWKIGILKPLDKQIIIDIDSFSLHSSLDSIDFNLHSPAMIVQKILWKSKIEESDQKQKDLSFYFLTCKFILGDEGLWSQSPTIYSLHPEVLIIDYQQQWQSRAARESISKGIFFFLFVDSSNWHHLSKLLSHHQQPISNQAKTFKLTYFICQIYFVCILTPF